MSENSPKVPASEKINTPEQRDRQAKLLTRFLDIAEHIGPLEGGKVADELKTEEDRRFLLEQLSNQQILRLVNGMNGLLRGKDKGLWVMDGGEVRLEGFIGTQIPPRSEDKLDLLEKAFNGMRNMAREDRSMEDIAILGSLSINAVHPYAEANGRTSRLLYLLLIEGYNPEVKPSIKTALGEYGRDHIDISPGLINFRITDLITAELGINDAEKNINRIGGWIPSGTGPYEEMQFQAEITEDLKRDFIRLIREDYRYTFFALYTYVNSLPNAKDFLEEYSPHSAIVLNKLVQPLIKENLEEILSIYWELKRRHTELLIDCVANSQKPEYVIQEEDQETTILDYFKKQIKQQRGFPKKKAERITEIEVRPAQEVLDEIYYGSPDYSDYDIPDEFILGEEEIEKPQGCFRSCYQYITKAGFYPCLVGILILNLNGTYFTPLLY